MIAAPPWRQPGSIRRWAFCTVIGRPSPALDLVEEFRPLLADRLALSLINRRQLNERDFRTQTTAQSCSRRTLAKSY